jgi:GNAT superfamily N-acetyltransferase
MLPTYCPRITRLGPQHQADLRGLVLGLDHAWRGKRFACAASDVPLVRHSQRDLTTATWSAGAFVDERLRGVVEVFDTGLPGTVEAAFLVEHGWRRRGLGTTLLQAAMQWAVDANRVTLRMVFSRRNWPMRKLASNADARLDLAFDDISADIAIVRDSSRPSFLPFM